MDFAATIGAESAAIDVASATLADRLRELRAAIVIHTAGPFQGQDYAVGRACIAAGAHYIDLADGRDFVCGIGALDAEATARGVLVTSGASTLPAVSAAVVDALRKRFAQLRSIATSIAPAQRIPRGEATLAAVLSYCGRPFTWLQDGTLRTVYGWQDLRRIRHGGLGHRWMGACDVPDLALFPQRYPGVRTVTFHAALELAVLQWALWLMAVAVRAGLVRSWVPATRRLLRAAELLDPLGTEDGGMQVALEGESHDGRPLRLVWQLVAHQGHGPEIPCVPAIVLARKLARGALSRRGALPCIGLLTLEEFDAAVDGMAIRWTVEEHM